MFNTQFLKLSQKSKWNLQQRQEKKISALSFPCETFFPVFASSLPPDGLFGQCLSSKQDKVQYQVSVQVLKRMQEVLKQLMLQGDTDFPSDARSIYSLGFLGWIF